MVSKGQDSPTQGCVAFFGWFAQNLYIIEYTALELLFVLTFHLDQGNMAASGSQFVQGYEGTGPWYCARPSDIASIENAEKKDYCPLKHSREISFILNTLPRR